MGYTHYFPHTKVSEKIWKTIIGDVKKIMDNLPNFSHSSDDCYPGDRLKLANWNGDKGTKPVIDKEEICFNGEQPLDHETFALLKNGSDGSGFCKTARKPYNLIVQACLLIYKYHSPDTIELRSDGCKDDWEEAVTFVMEKIRRPVANPFIE